MGGQVRTAGRALGLCLILFLLAFSVPAAEPRLVYADTAEWQSDLLVLAESADAVQISNCAGVSMPPVRVAESGAVVVERFGLWQCGAPIGLTPFLAAPQTALRSIVRYDDTRGRMLAFEVPPLDAAATWSSYAIARGVQNDARFEAALVLFNEGALPVVLTIGLFDGQNELVAIEHFETPPGLGWYPILARFGVGRVEVHAVPPGYGCPGCNVAPSIYGFATVALRALPVSPRVIPFEEIQ